MQNILTTDIQIVDIAKEDLKNLATLVAQRQKTPDFMRFLKEMPMTPKQNLKIFQKESDSPHCMFKWIQIEGITNAVWFLLFHCFNDTTKEIELGFRVDPLLQKKWICTQAVRESIEEILSQTDIESIVWRHSARNTWSFGVFKKSWFQIADFVPQQTFLPNIWATTDDFKRRISRESLLSPNLPQINQEKLPEIQTWLSQHKIHLL